MYEVQNYHPYNTLKTLKREIETTLIEKAVGGDAGAFNEIYSLLCAPVYGFAYRMLGEKTTAEDITQEVFIFFIENPDKYQSTRGSLLSFLCGVTRNRIMHYLRKRGNNPEIIQENNFEVFDFKDECARDPLKVLLEQELYSKVEEGVAKLSPLLREVIILREMQELSYDEIAKITGADVNAVKVRLYRARRNLANQLAPYLISKKENCHGMR